MYNRKQEDLTALIGWA